MWRPRGCGTTLNGVVKAMESISNSVKIIKGNLGLKIKGQKDRWHGVPPPARMRGDITGFSAASRRRLRETLAMARPKDETLEPWGFCLTIPGSSLPPSTVRDLWHEFVNHHFKRCFEDVPMVWRIELQQKQRQQAHWHCVIWCHLEQAALIREEWISTVLRYSKDLTEKTMFGINEHCVKMESLKGASASGIIGYLADHTSKHKQEQLGWKGRQWGVVNRSMLDFSPVSTIEATEDEHKKAARQFRRLQKNLRERGGSYTGVRVACDGKVSTAIFGRDEARFLACLKMAKMNSDGGNNG